MKRITILAILTMLLAPTSNAIASPSPRPPSTMQADIDRAMRYKDTIEAVFNKSKRNYGSMMDETLHRMDTKSPHYVFLIALAAKASGGRRGLLNNNDIGLFQIRGFGPFQKFLTGEGVWIDNRYYLTRVKRNIKEAILLLDKILEEVWKAGILFYRYEIIKIAERFHCTPNRYEDIVYECDGGREWGEDFYYNYYPAAERLYHK